MTINGVSALVKVFTGTVDEAPHKFTQAYFMKDNIVYIITYDATIDLYDKYIDLFNLTAHTFRFGYQ